MIIEKNINAYTIFSDEPFHTVLEKIGANKRGFLFCLDSSGVLEGLITDGDIRRWLITQHQINLDQVITQIINRQFVYANIDEDKERIKRFFSEEIKFVPLLDYRSRLVALARRRTPQEMLRIGDHVISDNGRVFVIAEIGINHNGCMTSARRLIEAAEKAGVDCVKFQMRNMDALYRHCTGGTIMAEDLGTQYTVGLLSRFELTVPEMFELFDYTRELGLTPLCTPWEEQSLRILEDYGMPAYKIASADLTNHPLLASAARTHKPLIVSTGMSTDEEISESVKLLQNSGANYCLLHCNSTYPAPFKDIHINYLARLKEIGQCPVGFSGHERGFYISIAAVAKGARIVEKHITLNRDLEGSDHKVSLLPNEFKEMVKAIRQVEEALGMGESRKMSQGEVMNRANLAKSLIVNRDLNIGEIIGENMIEVRSPGRGLQPNFLRQLVGKSSRRIMQKGDFFYPSDLGIGPSTARSYNFKRSWGVTVRWHDFVQILSKSNPEFLEFHLSYRDMEEDYERFFPEPLDLDLKVHSPDTFAGDHLLDLSNPNLEHRERSIFELQRVVGLTRRLTPYFRKAARPVIIASLGGFDPQGPISKSQVTERYEILAESLHKLDSDGVEIIGQTLPPFPWYFGGQMFLNLFVHAEDTAAFCQEHRLRLCLDVSHSKLVCNHFHYSFRDFIRSVGPYVAHLHVADARGVDGEGLQIGDGDIDFPALAAQLDEECPHASFIPEIWLGHKNEGEGFWKALECLEGMF